MVNSTRQDFVLVLSVRFSSVVLYFWHIRYNNGYRCIRNKFAFDIIHINSSHQRCSSLHKLPVGILSRKQVILKTNANKFNTVYNMDCASEIPSRVFTGVGSSSMSKVKCTLLCLGESGCRGGRSELAWTEQLWVILLHSIQFHRCQELYLLQPR